MKKLLIIGSETIHTYNYIELVQDFFDEILLITDKKRPGYEINTVELDFSLTLKNLRKTSQAIKQQIKDFQPSVIHIHQANSFAFYGLMASKSFNIPTILTIWGSDVLVNPKKHFLLKKMTQYNLKNADYITADAHFIIDDVKKLAKIKHEVIIANFGIGIQAIAVEKENIVYSNRLHKQLYRIDQIIRTFDLFSAKNPDWKLVIAATGEETEKLKKLVQDLQLQDKVEFVGWIDKIQNEKWYSKAKIWVSIPESDATSISLLEAMMCQCIPVVSDLPANKEWIENGVNGIIVSDFSEEFISKALSLNFEKAVLMNKERILKDGTKEANKEKFIQLYQKALGL